MVESSSLTQRKAKYVMRKFENIDNDPHPRVAALRFGRENVYVITHTGSNSRRDFREHMWLSGLGMCCILQSGKALSLKHWDYINRYSVLGYLADRATLLASHLGYAVSC